MSFLDSYAALMYLPHAVKEFGAFKMEEAKAAQVIRLE